MLEAPIPKDIRKYDAKLIGPFTLRQLLCFLMACLLSFLSYKFLFDILGKDATIFLCFILSTPFIVVGWYKPYGMPLEKFLRSALISTVLAPKNRKYKTNNYFREGAADFKPMSDGDYKKRVKKEKKLAINDPKYESFK